MGGPARPDPLLRPVTALILAGGAGRRMGGADQGLVHWCGRPLLAWVLAAIAPQTSHILISANRHLDRYRRFGHPVLSDPEPGLGPLGGLLAARPHLPPGHWLLTVPCDTPRLPADLVARLGAGTDQAVRIAAGERPHWLVALHPPGSLDDLPAYLARGGRAVGDYLRRKPHRLVPFSEAAFVNLNDRAALEALPCPP